MTLSDPDISAKLAVPAKKSVFERQKADAEAKKAREKAETAAALEDFVKSFDDDGTQQPGLPQRRGPGDGGRGAFGGGGFGASTPGKRHFTNTGLKSGPGSLGPSPAAARSGPGSLGPTPGFGKKRQFDEYSGRQDRDRKDRIFSYGEVRGGGNGRESGAFAREEAEDTKDSEELKAAAKPTLHLSSLPPGTSPAVIKGLFAPSPLTVENVRILPPVPGSTVDRRAVSAIVTLAAETPATDIDTMVSYLQNKYLGFGFNLSISRHLSSAALSGGGSLGNNAPSNSLNLPFGAKPISQHNSLSRAPPPGQGPGRFAPPVSYTSSTPYGPRSVNNQPPTQVNVQIPTDLKQLRLVHKTIEALLTHGPEFEALLMSRPAIQRDEQWSWLWDSKSTEGVYYRWRLWEILTDAKTRRKGQRFSAYGSRPEQGYVMFEGQSTWASPKEDLKFEYTTRIEEFISDEDYNSSDEEDADDDRGSGLAGRYRDHQKMPGNDTIDTLGDTDGQGYLNPLAKTKLIHLLSRLPETNAKLRKGDVARVTGFAIEHAGAGANEVAEMVTRNVVKPFRYSIRQPKGEDNDEDEVSEHAAFGNVMPKHSPTEDGAEASVDKQTTSPDTTASSLVALYVISDILSASSTSGVRHAWRYRSLIQHHLLRHKTFENLGQLPKKYQWGKLRAEKWKRQVQVIIALWEGWSVFEEAKMKEIEDGFLNPPLTKEEKEREEEKTKLEGQGAGKDESKGQSRWRSVGDTRGEAVGADGRPMLASTEDSDVEMNMDGTPMADEDDDGDTVLTDENLDGVPMVDSSDDEIEDLDQKAGASNAIAPQPSTHETEAADADSELLSKPVHVPAVSQGRRMRPKAVDFDDMFE